MRRGDQDVNCRIVLHINHYPEKFRILPPLAEIIAMKEGTRAEAMSAVWKLVKTLGAQDKDDGSILKRIGDLEKVCRKEAMNADVRFYLHKQILFLSINYPNMSLGISPIPTLSLSLIRSVSTETSLSTKSVSISQLN